MDDCSSSDVSHQFLRVKEEPVDYLPPSVAVPVTLESTYIDSCHWHGSCLIDNTSPAIECRSVEVQVKVEPKNEQHSDSLNKEECVNDDEMKEELSWSDSLDCGVSDAASLAGLYRDHEVKNDLVLGLECSHRPDVNLVVREGTLGKGLKDCCVRLKRLPTHEAMLADNEYKITTQNTNHTDSESDEEEFYRRADCEKEPTCDLCGECFALKSDLVEHVIEHIYVPSTNNESGPDGVGCAVAKQCKQDPARERALCRKYALRDCCVRLERLRSDAPLAGHQRRTASDITTRADTEFDTEDDIYNYVDCDKEPTCDICGQRFSLMSDLKKHVMIHIHMPTTHDESPAATIYSDGFSDNEQEIDISVDCEKEPICHLCGDKFALYSNLMKHVMIHGLGTCPKRGPDTGKIYERGHTAKKFYSCNICQKKFITPSNLKRHARVHTGEKPYPCKFCNKSFAYDHSLAEHLRSHTGEKPYSCTTCSMRFAKLMFLKNHRLTHTWEQPYSCEICKKGFTQWILWKQHKIIHTGKKSYSCNLCNKRFRRLRCLNYHRSLHSVEKPYSCTMCNKGFRDWRSFKTHSIIHRVSYPCKACNVMFETEEDLEKHLTVHAGEKLYSCDICNEQFSDTLQLNRHKKTHLGYSIETVCDVERITQ